MTSIVALSLALGMGARGQVPGRGGPSQTLRSEVLSTWSTDQGLPQNFVTSLAQTPDGFIWVGTLNGLARFDGLHFKTFDKDGPPQLQEKIVNLVIDRRGGIWIATISRLFHYSHNHFEEIPLPHEKNPLLQVLTSAHDGGVWILYGDKLLRFKDGALKPEVLPSDAGAARGLVETGDGTLWIADRDRILAVLPDHSVVRYERPGVQVFYEDRSGHLYAGDGHTLFQLRDGAFRPVARPGLGNFVDLMVDHQGALWMASGGLHGLSRKDASRTEILTTKDGLASDDVRAILEDSNGDIWVGTIAGLQRFHHGIFTSYTIGKEPVGTHGEADAIFEQKNGAIWVGTLEGGVVKFQGEKRTFYGRKQGLPTGQVRGFAGSGATPDIAISDYGIFQLRGKKFEKIPSIPKGYVTAPVITADGSLWFSVLHRGLFRLKDKKLSNIEVGTVSSNDSVMYLATDQKGDLWAGTSTQLEHWNGTHFEPVVGTPSPVLSVAWPKQGLAIGTMRGLMLWADFDSSHRDPKGGKILTQADGLPGGFVLDVVADAEDNLWVVRREALRA